MSAQAPLAPPPPRRKKRRKVVQNPIELMPGVYSVQSGSDPKQRWIVDVPNQHCGCPATVKCYHLEQMTAIHKALTLSLSTLRDDYLPRYFMDEVKQSLVLEAINLRVNRLAKEQGRTPEEIRWTYLY